METALDLVLEFKTEILLLIGGAAFGPTLAAVIIRLLYLPVIRDLVAIPCVLFGVWLSKTLTRFFPKTGEKLEDAILDFLQFVRDKIAEGANRDDKVSSEG